MNILGPDTLIFDNEDLEACARYLAAYGLEIVTRTDKLVVGRALDGTSMEVRLPDDPELPPTVVPTPNLRLAVYGVADDISLKAIAAELVKDREVTHEESRIVSHDDDGYPIAFQVTQRHAIDRPAYGVNCPGTRPGRAPNTVAAIAEEKPMAYTLSHFVLFTRDRDRAERFYAERLNFRTVDVFDNLGPFMRPTGTLDHHTLFLIQANKLGMQHFTFHFAGANEILKAGWDMVNAGFTSEWGPGRHILGSNFFWYFQSPFGCIMEMDADMDLHDDNWEPRHIDADEHTSQTFVFSFSEKYSPEARRRKRDEAAHFAAEGETAAPLT